MDHKNPRQRHRIACGYVDTKLENRLKKCRDATQMAETAIRIARRRSLKIEAWERQLREIRPSNWAGLRELAASAENVAIDRYDSEHTDEGLATLFETRKFFATLIQMVDVVRPPRFSFRARLTPCSLCGAPTHRGSAYYCPNHRYDGRDYRTVRRMEKWALSQHGMQLTDLVKQRQKAIGCRLQQNPDLILERKAAAEFRGKMLRSATSVLDLVTLLVGEFEPPSDQFMALVALIAARILQRHEAWLEIVEEYRTPRGGRPRNKTIDAKLPDARTLREQGVGVRAIGRQLNIPHNTLSRRLSK